MQTSYNIQSSVCRRRSLMNSESRIDYMLGAGSGSIDLEEIFGSIDSDDGATITTKPGYKVSSCSLCVLNEI